MSLISRHERRTDFLFSYYFVELVILTPTQRKEKKSNANDLIDRTKLGGRILVSNFFYEFFVSVLLPMFKKKIVFYLCSVSLKERNTFPQVDTN